MREITEAEALVASLDLTAAEVAHTAAGIAALADLSLPQLMTLTARIGASLDRARRVAWCGVADRAEVACIETRLRAWWQAIEEELRRRTGEDPGKLQ